MKKQIFALLCAGLLCVTFVACNQRTGSASVPQSSSLATAPTAQSSNTPKDSPVTGHWHCQMDMTEVMGSMPDMEVDTSAYDGELVLGMNWVFNPDGTYQMMITDEDWMAFLNGMEAMYKAIIKTVFEESIRQNAPSMTPEEYLAATDRTWDDVYAASDINAMLNTMERLENSSGIYKVENGKLYTTENSFFQEDDGVPFELTEDELRVVLPIDEQTHTQLTLKRAE